MLREQLVEWLRTIGDALPLTYVIEAMDEVGKTSTLRRRTGALEQAQPQSKGPPARDLRRFS